MSAESPSSTQKLQKPTGNSSLVITPQEVTDPTILDSVAGFINEVVPTAYNEPTDIRDQIQWAHFEHLDHTETAFLNFDTDEAVHSPLILVLGYVTGIQIWALLANGEATEILSWRHGSVRVLRILPNPYSVDRIKKDAFASKRPLIALCDNPPPGSSQAGSLSIVSLKTSEQVKLIKFKNPILDVLANKQSVVVTFFERIAVFDAFTLEDRLTITTCYPSPGVQPNPVALGARWLAYAEKKLHSSKRSSGGSEGEGVQSYTATVLHAAKSLGRGLRELGETVASSLTGNSQYKPGSFPGGSQSGSQSDGPQKGIVTVLDIASQSVDTLDKNLPSGSVIAHFAAHNEAIVCLSFDPSGMLLLTADKRGHDFHLFRIHPHPAGSGQAAVHHLYVLHRGDTSAKVQDMCFSPDSRWVAVSTLRGTTHVFAVTPYGGHVGVRTHTTPYVVNKMSRFHRSAGLTSEGRSNSPVSIIETPVNTIFPYYNPRYPPYPHPTVGHPLAQIRQPLYIQSTNNAQTRTLGGRQRLTSSSEENIALRVVACFAPPRAWLDTTPPLNEKAKPVESLFIMSCYGMLVQYDLDPHHTSSVPKDRVCDDTAIDLTVSAKAQWMLQRKFDGEDVPLPMLPHNLALIMPQTVPQKNSVPDHHDEQWLSQVEIVTHAGPHRRLWMGPQFEFKTYTVTNGSLSESRPIDVRRSKPVNMPVSKTNAVLIESSSAGSGEISLFDTYHKSVEDVSGLGELQLKEDLADAMQECHVREGGGRCVLVPKQQAPVAKVVNPLGTVVTIHSDDDQDFEVSEESVIHENCDEALFRPVVAAKPIQQTDNKYKYHYHYNDDIIVHSLHSTNEVAVRLPEKIVKDKDNRVVSKKPDKSDPNESLSLPAKTKSKDVKTEKQTDTNKFTKNKTNLIEVKSNNSETKFNKSKSNQYVNNVVNLLDSGCDNLIIADSKLDTFDVTETLNDTSRKSFSSTTKSKSKNKNGNGTKDRAKADSNKQNSEMKIQTSSILDDKPLIFDDLDAPVEKSELDLESTKIDPFEDARDCDDSFSYSIEPLGEDMDPFSYKYQGLEPSEVVEEVGNSEKSVSKKPRKPKPKLGIRIAQVDTSSKSSKRSEENTSGEFSLPQPKLSYNVVTSKSTDREKSPALSSKLEKSDRKSEESVSGEYTPKVRPMAYSSIAASKPPCKESSPSLSDTEKSSKDLEDFISNEYNVPQVKLSYNVVAASKSAEKEKSPSLSEMENESDLPLIDCVENFTLKLPKKSTTKKEEKLIDIDSPPEMTTGLEDSFECQSDSKKDSVKDKSSDDEKIDSTVETTESDDSAKVSPSLLEEPVLEAEKTFEEQPTRSAKRKAKKKKK